MCGRYALVTPADVLAKLFELTSGPGGIIGAWSARYNIAPTHMVPVVRADEEGGRRIDLLKWGLIPSWAKDASIGARMINARSETAAEKPSFRAAFARRRCIVPVDGFYEWKKTESGKQPVYIHRADGMPLAFAGLWEHWMREDEVIESFTICTTDANATLRDVHDRMPVILEAADFTRWLDPRVTDGSAVAPLLRPAPDELLAMHPVSTRVNRVQNDDAGLIAEAEEIPEKKPGTGEDDRGQGRLF
jgi:putative SOS response-associated peptidase YedK